LGNWNEKIYGGDAPLDWKENMYTFCGAEEFGELGEKSKAIPKELLISNMEGLQDMLDSSEEVEDGNIGYIVLGALIMRSGLDFNGIEERILKAIEEDEQAKENHVRKIVMINYKKLIKEYDSENPVNVDDINLLDESEDSEEEELGEEFKQIFGLMIARIKKLKRGIGEKSGIKEYDEGYADASQESIDFLEDFKELISKQEQFGILLDRIESGVSFSSGESGGNTKKAPSGSVDGGKDIVAG
jgi:thiol-disulfide isomerase/thioredoxin